MNCVDELPAALDGRRIRNAGEDWLVEIYSATERDSRCWMQVGICGQSTFTLLVNMPVSADSDRAALAIRDWLARPNRQSGQVLRID